MKIGVLGIGITKFGERWDQGLRDLLLDAQLRALNDSKIDSKQSNPNAIGIPVARTLLTASKTSGVPGLSISA